MYFDYVKDYMCVTKGNFRVGVYLYQLKRAVDYLKITAFKCT